MRQSFSLLFAFPFLGIVAVGCGIDTAPGGTGGATGSGGTAGAGGGASGGGAATGGGGNVDESCSTGADCSLISRTCCGSCGSPTVSDMTAVAKGSEEAYRDSVCGGDIACPACAALQNPNLFAVCVLPSPNGPGHCEAKDIVEQAAAKCAVDSDCVVKPRACCECGAGSESSNLVALRADSLSFLSDSLCEANYACDECAWIAPPEVTAICDAGACAVKDSRPVPF